MSVSQLMVNVVVPASPTGVSRMGGPPSPLRGESAQQGLACRIQGALAARGCDHLMAVANGMGGLNG